MNLADAIRKAAHRSEPVETPKPHWSEDGSTVLLDSEGLQEVDPQESIFAKDEIKLVTHSIPIAPEHSTMPGNAIRLEIFLSGEQMTGMLKAIMTGQHTVLTLREAASYLRISSNTLLKLAEEGEIPAVEIDGRYRFPKSNLDDWMAMQSLSGEEGQDVA